MTSLNFKSTCLSVLTVITWMKTPLTPSPPQLRCHSMTFSLKHIKGIYAYSFDLLYQFVISKWFPIFHSPFFFCDFFLFVYINIFFKNIFKAVSSRVYVFCAWLHEFNRTTFDQWRSVKISRLLSSVLEYVRKSARSNNSLCVIQCAKVFFFIWL